MGQSRDLVGSRSGRGYRAIRLFRPDGPVLAGTACKVVGPLDPQNRRENSRKLLKRVAGVEGLEPPTLGLENPYRTVPPVWPHAFSLGYGTSYSGHETQFGHEYAPHYAPRPESKDAPPTTRSLDDFVSLQSILPRISVSKRRLKQLDAIQLVRDKRESRKIGRAHV